MIMMVIIIIVTILRSASAPGSPLVLLSLRAWSLFLSFILPFSVSSFSHGFNLSIPRILTLFCGKHLLYSSLQVSTTAGREGDQGMCCVPEATVPRAGPLWLTLARIAKVPCQNGQNGQNGSAVTKVIQVGRRSVTESE